MRIGRIFTTILNPIRRVLHVLARPVHRHPDQGGIVIHPYRGYGSQQEVFLMGRVLKRPKADERQAHSVLGDDLINIARRLFQRGVANAVLLARFCGDEQQVRTDRDGYFYVHLRPRLPVPSDHLWHELDLELVQPITATATGHVFVPPHNAEYVVISDIDDTVVYTGVANKVKMLWRLFAEGAQSRVAFPGVAALYQALHGGTSGARRNPLLYVSRGPWSLYEVLEEFFNLHGIPVGPVLFLREWGISLRHPFPRRAVDHKTILIRDMLALYHDLPFILIGDSGQHDPEIYSQIVRENPGRVLAIYIRNVSHNQKRIRAIEELASEVSKAGSSLVLAADSFVMAEHAAEHNLIRREALADVLIERIEQEDEPDFQTTRTVKRSSPQQTSAAVQQGALEAALTEESSQETPPNVVIEPETEDASQSRPDRRN